MNRRLSNRISSVALMGALALFAPLVSASPAVPQMEKIALVEFQRCMLETAQGIKAKKKLESTFAKGQAKLDRESEELAKEVEDLKVKATMLSPAELERRQITLMQKQEKLQQLYLELQQELSQEEAKLVEKVYKNVSGIVAQIAKEEGIQIVLVRSPETVLYANPKLDLTNRIIVAYDKKYP